MTSNQFFKKLTQM